MERIKWAGLDREIVDIKIEREEELGLLIYFFTEQHRELVYLSSWIWEREATTASC
jgi:hypothetical protein